ncbi:unnamed protein product, partial [Polarella glacialis]
CGLGSSDLDLAGCSLFSWDDVSQPASGDSDYQVAGIGLEERERWADVMDRNMVLGAKLMIAINFLVILPSWLFAAGELLESCTVS